jgi:hypothetical protein
MYVNPFQVSLETLVGVSPMLGHNLEDRSRIRNAQDLALIHELQASSSVRLRHPAEAEYFCVAPLDILVCEHEGRKQFHLIEINGTGIGGLTNLSGQAVSAVLEGLSDMARDLKGDSPVVLVASSGKENDQSPRMNRLVHEKVLYVEALKRGFDYSGREPAVLTMPHLLRKPEAIQTGKPTIVLGYIKDFQDHLKLDNDGRLSLMGRPVDAGINDRFCLNVVQQFGGRVDLSRFLTMNRCFLAGADKGVAYTLLNEFLARHRFPSVPDRVEFARAHDRQTLIATVLDWVRQGRKAVIKPQGTGLGHGIEFFLSQEETAEQIVARIDGSLKQTEELYRAPGGALPYTVCEYIDTCTIRRQQHPLFGHKYELRVVVYRDGMSLNAFPSIVKISSEAFDAAGPSHLSLINNITTSAEATKAQGVEFMLPLANRETLALLDLQPKQMQELCRFATGFIRYTLDKVHHQPECLGLPARVPAQAPTPATVPLPAAVL